jgi:hypothetical protein
MNAQEILEHLTEAYARRDLIALAKKEAIPADVHKILEDNQIAFEDKINANAALISDLEAQAKEAVLKEGETAKGGALQAVYVKGRVSWDTRKLDGMMIVIPELNQARKVGEPSVTIRKVG